MDERSKKRLPWMIGAVVVLLLFMLIVPRFKTDAPSGGSSPSSPSIITPPGTERDGGPLALDMQTSTTDPVLDGGFSLGGGEIFSLAWRLALVLLVLGVCVVGLRWWAKRASGPRSSTGYLRIVDTLPFQGGRSVHLIAVGERVLVVGATAQQLSFLAELKDEEATSLLEARTASVEPSVSAFAAQLLHSLRRDGRPPASVHADMIGGIE